MLLELASLTDIEAKQCLNRVLSSVKETRPDVPVTSPADLGNILKAAAALLSGQPLSPKADSSLRDPAKAIRILLLEFRENVELTARLEAALAADRSVLVDPITTALVMAGIVVILQTRFKMDFKRDKGNKSEFQVTVEKLPSSEGIIKKFFALF